MLSLEFKQFIDFATPYFILLMYDMELLLSKNVWSIFHTYRELKILNTFQDDLYNRIYTRIILLVILMIMLKHSIMRLTKLNKHIPLKIAKITSWLIKETSLLMKRRDKAKANQVYLWNKNFWSCLS